MNIGQTVFTRLDAALILLYRLPEDSLSGFLLGTLALVLACVLAGELAMLGAMRLNRSHYRAQDEEMTRMHNLSIRAVAGGDKTAYKAANKLANEAFGKAFFARAALFSVSLWPVPFALGWMAARFQGVDIPIPFTDAATHYVAVFLAMYVPARVLFSRIKPRLPLFRTEIALQAARRGERMLSWSELSEKKEDSA